MRRWVFQQGISSFSKTHLRIIFPSQLYHLLQSCSKFLALIQGRQVHQQIILHGLDSNPFMATKLVQMYADCNDLISARILFDQSPQPNVFAWTPILAFYSRTGMYRKCLQTYDTMRSRGITPDNYIFPNVLRACAQSLSLKEGIQIHKDIVRFGSELNLQVCNSLIDMYSKCGDAETARCVFDEMVERDQSSWNSMISGYVYNGFLDLAIEMLVSMRLGGFKPDLVCWNTIMDAYCRMGLCEEASKIFKQIQEPNIISWTTLISGYSRVGKFEMSLGLFREMMNRAVVFPDPDALSSILVSCRHLDALRNGQEIHGYGIKTQTRCGFYYSAGAALLTMYAGYRRVRDAVNVFKFMEQSDVVAWNAMILGFAQLGMGDSALKLFIHMQSTGIKHNPITISTILPLCDLKLGKQIHAHIKRNCLDSAIPVCNSLINMYSRCGCIGAAYTIFLNMVIRDVVSWNTMIGGYGIHGHGRAALQLLQDMNQTGIHPNSVTFTSVLSACSHSGLVDEGLELFNSLNKDFNFVPAMEHYGCVVDLLARAGRLADAVDFINKMAIDPDKSIWGALLAASRAHQNISSGRLAAEHLFLLEPRNPGNYVTLSNIYARAGRWNDAVQVRKLMEARGLVKPSGYSWIDTIN